MKLRDRLKNCEINYASLALENEQLKDQIRQLTVSSTTLSLKNRVNKPELKEGEIYAGAIINPDGTGHHIILLPGDNDDAEWQAQMDWAKSIGGDLPDRVEQAMLLKYLPEQFKANRYWSCALNASYASCAWGQSFLYGSQHDYDILNELRARAVRRVTIGEQ